MEKYSRLKAAIFICRQIDTMIENTKNKKYLKQLKTAKTLIQKSTFDFGDED